MSFVNSKQDNYPLRRVNLDASGQVLVDIITEYCEYNVYVHLDKKYMEYSRDLTRNTRQMVVLFNIFSRAYHRDGPVKRGRNLFDYMSKFCNRATHEFIDLESYIRMAQSEEEILDVLEMLWQYILKNLVEYEGVIDIKEAKESIPELKALTPDKKVKPKVKLQKATNTKRSTVKPNQKTNLVSVKSRSVEGTRSLGKEKIRELMNRIKVKKQTMTLLERAMVYFRLECPDIQYVDFERDNDDYKYILAIGDVQSGKTLFSICVMAYTVLLKIPCVYVVKGEKAQYRQFANHLNHFNKNFTEYMKRNGFNVGDIPCMYIGDSTQFNEEQFVDTMSGITPGIVIALCNSTQIQRIVKTLNEYESDDWEFSVVADEADELCYHKKETAVRTVFEELRQKCKRIYGITATGYEQLLCETELLRDSVIVLTPRQGYKGPMQLTFKILPHKAISYGPKDDMETILEKDPNLSFYCDELSQQEPFNISATNRKHPIIALHKTTRYTAQHEQILNYLRKHYPNKFAVLIFNGDGVRLFHHSLKGEKITIGSRNFSEDPKMRGTHILSDVTIQSAIQYLKDSGGAERFPRIVIISGDLADRGINFVSEDFKWHLTHEYLLMSNRKWNLVPDLVQALRLCGVYQDEIPLSLYTTERIKDNIINGYHFQKDKLFQLQIEMIEDDVLRKRYLKELAEDNIVVKDLIAELPTSKQKIGKAKFSNNKYVLNRIDGEDGGISVDELNEIKGEITEMWNTTQKEEQIIDYKTEGLKRLDRNVRKALLHNRDTVVLRIIRYLSKHIQATKEQIKKNCKASDFGHYDKWVKENGRYKIVVEKKNGMYIINPEIKHIVSLVT